VSQAPDLGEALAASPSVAAARAALEDRTGVWVVGGAVRDAALGEEVLDTDLVVPPGQEEEMARTIGRAASGFAFPLSSEHGVWRAVPPEDDWHVDVVAQRGGAIEDDLRERDFTVNAVAVPLAGGDPLDPTGGLADVADGVLRMVSPEAFEADPLRLLRGPRIAAGHGLKVEPGTAAAIRERAAQAGEPAGERQFSELRGLIGGPAPLRGLELMDELGLTATVLPELESLRGVAQNPNHHLDVHGHTLTVLEEWLKIESDLEAFAGELAHQVAEFLAEPLADELTRGQALRFGALLHDIGKPQTRGERGGYVTFIGHDTVGAEIVASICRRLRTSRHLSTHLQGLALHHLRLGFLVHERPLSRRAIYDYLSATAPVAPDVTLLSAADRLAARGSGPLAAPEMVEAHMQLSREMLAEALAWHRDPPEPPLDGDELASALGLDPGPEVGRILEELRIAAFAGELPGHEDALAMASRLAKGDG
jgi:putative nucleotidyltransferase with HDIG domain